MSHTDCRFSLLINLLGMWMHDDRGNEAALHSHDVVKLYYFMFVHVSEYTIFVGFCGYDANV